MTKIQIFYHCLARTMINKLIWTAIFLPLPTALKISLIDMKYIALANKKKKIWPRVE